MLEICILLLGIINTILICYCIYLLKENDKASSLIDAMKNIDISLDDFNRTDNMIERKEKTQIVAAVGPQKRKRNDFSRI